jgi:hypothetical protein
LERGPFGSLSSTNLKGSLTINSEFCLNIPRNFVRYELGLNSVNMPTNSNIQYCGSNSFLNCTVPNIVVPASCNYFSYACFGRTESGLGVPTPSTLTFKSEQFVGYMPNDGTTYASILYGLRYTPLGDGTGKGRLYVKNETLRQQYINDPN